MKPLAPTLALAVLIVISGACSQTSPTAPTAADLPPPFTAPASVPAVTPVPTYTLSGVVTQMTPAGLVPVEGVRLHWSEMHLDATTNADGFYSLNVLRGASPFLASKDGYKGKMLFVTVREDVRLDIELDLSVPTPAPG